MNEANWQNDKKEIQEENQRRNAMGGFDISYSDMRLFAIAVAPVIRNAQKNSKEFREIFGKECSIEEQKRIMAIADNVLR